MKARKYKLAEYSVNSNGNIKPLFTEVEIKKMTFYKSHQAIVGSIKKPI